jgi:hypothetical protein
MSSINLLLSAALLACPSQINAQDSTAARPQAELAREADSIRAAYADSVSQGGIRVKQPSQPPVESSHSVRADLRRRGLWKESPRQ